MKPLLYDVFCKAGGCTKGYQNAGFYVVGIDHEPQPRYCGDEFIQMDALEFFQRYLAGEYPEAAAFHTSPPCQRYTRAQNATKNAGAHPDLIAPVRELLIATGKPYIIENVVGAPLVDPKVLCGISFGLMVRRHRLFETNFFFLVPPDQCKDAEYFVIFGESIRSRRHMDKPGRKNYRSIGRQAMGIDWMTCAELSEAIPPAFTEFTGEQLLNVLERTP